jgi:hypothetical protein
MLWGAAQQAGVRDLLAADCRMALNWRDLDFVEAGNNRLINEIAANFCCS